MRYRQQGGGMVEIMVGLAIGLVTLLTIYSSLAFYQATKRSAVSGNSALANALAGIELIANDVRLAGLGLTANNSLACTRWNAFFNGTAVANNRLVMPVHVQAGSFSSDNITVMFGDSVSGGAPARLLTDMTSPTSEVTVSVAAGAQAAGVGVLANPGSNMPCTLIGITGVITTPSSSIVRHDSGSSPFNPPNPSAVYQQAPAYPQDAVLMTVNTFRWVTWRVNNFVLERVDNITGQVEQIADNVVQLHAEYGVTDGVSNAIDAWVPATGAWSNLTAANVQRIRALRLAVVARSLQRERNLDAAGDCQTTVTPPTLWAGGMSANLSQIPNWRCYRYRVVKTVVPLKNVLWGGG